MNREGTMKKCDNMSRTWDAVTAKKIHPGAGKFTIQHEFQYRSDISSCQVQPQVGRGPFKDGSQEGGSSRKPSNAG